MRTGEIWRTHTYDEYPVTCKLLMACPLCEHEFELGDSRPKHFLDEHGPEDIGL